MVVFLFLSFLSTFIGNHFAVKMTFPTRPHHHHLVVVAVIVVFAAAKMKSSLFFLFKEI